MLENYDYEAQRRRDYARYVESMRADFERRDAQRQQRFAQSLAAPCEPASRSPREADELRARLARLQSEQIAPIVHTVAIELDD